jgi:hydrogenase nickel incorporation protein HypA/HybF
MHEMGIVMEIVDVVSEASQGAKVARVVLEIGKLSMVVPDAVRFCFDLAAQGTPLEGAELAIVETPGRAACRDCGAEVILERPFGRCRCGGTDLEWLAGEELKIQTVEVS